MTQTATAPFYQSSANAVLYRGPSFPTLTAPVGHTANGSLLRRAIALLSGPLSPQHVLRMPLPVTIEVDDQGWFIISDDLFCQYGDGITREVAEADYRGTLAEYYELVAAGAPTSAEDTRELRELGRYILRRG